MSSLANAIKRRTHKERSQPAARRKYGLLEKKKDYVQRARDFHRKEKALKALQRKAEERNPDEFYFAMEKARTKDGVHKVGTAQANKYTQEELRLMRTQDEKYLALRSRMEEEKLKRMRGSLHFIGLAPQAKHTVFVDSAEEAAAFRPDEYFDTPKELLDRAYNRPRRGVLQQGSVAAAGARDPKAAAAAVQKADRRKLAAYKEAAQRQERQQKLAALADKMAASKQVMGKGRKRKVVDPEGAAPPSFVWKRERKK